MKHVVVVFGVGYLIAVFVAVVATEIIFFAPSILPDNGRFGSLAANLREIPVILWTGLLFTFMTSLPGYISTLTAAHLSNKHCWRFYCIGGIFTSLLAHVILAGFFDWKFHQGMMIILASMPGGAIGAYAYYRWKERFSSANKHS